jgi:hypothetical protein
LPPLNRRRRQQHHIAAAVPFDYIQVELDSVQQEDTPAPGRRTDLFEEKGGKDSLRKGRTKNSSSADGDEARDTLSHISHEEDYQDKADRWIAQNIRGGSMKLGVDRSIPVGGGDISVDGGDGQNSASGGGGSSGVTALMAACHQDSDVNTFFVNEINLFFDFYP